jgi:hypothetical protein
MRAENLTDSELLNALEASLSNELAGEVIKRFMAMQLDLANVAEAETAADEGGPSNQVEAMRDLCWNYEWVDRFNRGTTFHIKGLQEDSHPDNHSVSITRSRKAAKTASVKWQIRINSKELGEHLVEESFTGTLSEAQDRAVELAAEGMTKGNWLNYGL